MFGAMALDEEYWNKRIDKFIALAPVLIPNKKSKLFVLGSALQGILEKTLREIGIVELFGKDWAKVQGTVRALIPQITEVVISSFSTEPGKNDPTGIKIFEGHFPHGSSVR